MRAAAADVVDSNLVAPAPPCVFVEADSDGAARVRDSLVCGAAAVIVLCAVGEPLVQAREQLRELDEALRGTAVSLGARVSRSATDGLAAWAASCLAPIGVDVQAAPDALDDELLHAALDSSEQRWLAQQPQREAAFARLWAGKEAVLKAFGVGLAWSPRRVPVLPLRPAWHAKSIGALGTAWLSHLDAPGHRTMALAVALNAGHGSIRFPELHVERQTKPMSLPLTPANTHCS